MPAAQIVVHKDKVVIEQIDFTPSPGQIIVALDGKRYKVEKNHPEVRFVKISSQLTKWMNVVQAEEQSNG